ncbi:hypothetical protein PTTG_04149 [Puccinia triticina 1-1 BBBD Race 1]|uniref:protein-tyrosine-phosphatase n=1 Tax=Puccinia triticina (isolate 1-1 / race 1 (BBBD)) TaxID=630390 RepID=A0A180GSC3_PUCT1|nr:hypothetical protein PTTG_04149 [Puccinia triticina 1-1 BBBD Race 1]
MATPISPQQLISNHPNALILDIRPPSAFRQTHLSQAINLNLPTTLLKRPLYGPDRIQSGLPSQEERERFERYKTALPSTTTPPSSRLQLIIAIDQDARLISPSHPLILLLNKFGALGFQGQLLWLSGGFQALLALAQEPGSAHWATTLLISEQQHQHHNITKPTTPMSLSIPLPLSASLPTPPVTSHHKLSTTPATTTTTTTTTTNKPPQSHPKTKRFHMSLSMLPPPATTPLPQSPSIHHNTCYPSTTRSNDSTSKPNNNKTINPFFDNIRQLNERLSLDSSLQNLSPIELPELTNPVGDLPRLPPFLRRLLQDSPIQRAQRLAHEFHDLEMAEQHRLEDVMRWESSRVNLPPSSSDPTSATPSSSLSIPQQQQPQQQQQKQQPNHGSIGANRHHHPFSISAGVELGYKNRYKNIWPYEHTRIRLRSGQARRNETDYMNASMISFRSDGAPPLLSSTSQHQVGSRRYIATQGPLTSTFEDFWSVVGSEDVGLIIMITRRHEAGREKCADYLRNGQYGDLVVSVDLPPPSRSCTTTDGDGGDGGGTGMESDGDEEREMASGFFGFESAVPSSLNHHDHLPSPAPLPPPSSNTTGKSASERGKKKRAGVLRKTVRLSRTTRPDLPARQIAHIQYRGWPDFDVPPAAEDVLELIAESQRASLEIRRLNIQAVDDFVNNNSAQAQPGSKEDVRKAVGTGSGPVIVHCSAGVGRTGSFILLDIMTEVLNALYVSPRPPLPTHPSSRAPASPPIRSTTPQTAHPLPASEPPRRQPEALRQSPPSHSPAHLPRFLDSQLCDCVTGVAPIWQTYPIMAVVNEMREQRMSMVANYRQYVFLHEVLLTYLLKELDISVVGASEKGQATSSGPSTPTTTQTSTNTTTTAGTSSSSAGPTGRVPGAPEIGGLSSNDEHVPKPGHPSASRARGSPSHDPTKEAGTDSIGPSGILRCLSPSVASSATSTLPSHSASSEASSDLDIDPLGSRPARSPANLSAAPSAGDYFF